MKTKKVNQQDLDNLLILSTEPDPGKPEKPRNDEEAGGYNSSDDTGNSNDDLELNPDDDPNTNIDEEDLDTLNGLDLDEDETM